MATFEMVDQLAGLRQAFAGAPTPLESYAPAASPVSAAAPAPAAAGAHHAGDGHGHSAGELVALGRFQFDSSVLPKVQGLQKAIPGLRITSGYRSPEKNAATPGAAKNSWHMKGRAADYAGSAGDMQRGAAWAKANGAREVLIHNAGTGQHLHVAF